MNDSVRAAPSAHVVLGLDGRGLAAATSAFLIWGMLPLYLKVLQAVPVLQLAAHRVVWGCLFGFVLLALRGELQQVRSALGNPQILRWLCLSALMIAVNWLIFMWGIAEHRVVEVSLGYFINPLLNVVLGVVIFKERLNRAQWLAVSLAAAGVVYLGWIGGHPPWLSLSIAASFGLYGVIRKVAKVDALPGFAGETLLLLPIGLGYILWCEAAGQGAMSEIGWGLNALLLLSGPLTAIPLVLFAVGARRIPLSTVGLLQYMAPTIQLLGAVLVFNEPFSGPRVVGFALIWSGLAIYGIHGFLASRHSA